MAVKEFLKGMPNKFAGHKAAAITSLESAEADLWKAIRAGGASTAIKYELSIRGGNKMAKCITFLKEVRMELKDAQGGMKGHCTEEGVVSKPLSSSWRRPNLGNADVVGSTPQKKTRKRRPGGSSRAVFCLPTVVMRMIHS